MLVNVKLDVIGYNGTAKTKLEKLIFLYCRDIM